MGSLRSIKQKSVTYYRQVVFFYHDGWLSWIENGQEYLKISFEDELTQKQSFNRLRAAVDPKRSFFKKMVADADAKLTTLGRSEGIIVVDDWKQARAAISEVDQARWQVHTVNNIPRLTEPLRVLVWASTNTDETIFEQVVSLVSRTTTRPYPWELSFVFVPNDPQLKRLLLKWGKDHKPQAKKVGSPACFRNRDREKAECLACPVLYPCDDATSEREAEEIVSRYDGKL